MSKNYRLKIQYIKELGFSTIYKYYTKETTARYIMKHLLHNKFFNLIDIIKLQKFVSNRWEDF